MRRSSEFIGDKGEWTTVHVAANPFEAEIVRGLLDEESIPTLRQSDLGATIWGRPSGLRILVPRSEEASAREVLRAYQGRHLKVIHLADYLPPRTPETRALLYRLFPALIVPVVVLVVLSLALVVMKW
jgi:hypothetical protein